MHDGVRFLLDHLPRAAHLVIATRTEPPIGISRLRARAELDEIASEQLRFSDAEAAALLNDTLALALDADELTLLSERTEGWAAGLYLAGLSLRDRPGAPATPRSSPTTATSSTTWATRSSRPRTPGRAASWSRPACWIASARRCATPCAARAGPRRCW